MTQIINWINQVVVAVLHNDLMTLVKLIGAYGVFFIVFAESQSLKMDVEHSESIFIFYDVCKFKTGIII